MKLQTHYASGDEIPDTYKPLYTEQADGQWELTGIDLGKDALEKELADTKNELRKSRLEHTLRSAAAKSGVRPEAIKDVLAHSRDFVFDENGKPSCYDEKGVAHSPEDWLAGQIRISPHWLMSSNSSGIRQQTKDSNFIRNGLNAIEDVIKFAWKK